jgi:hypothetical protein
MTSIPLGGTRTTTRRAARSRSVAFHDGPEPWARRDAVLPGLLMLAGVIVLVIGWLGISDAVALERQTRWLAVSIVGLIVGGLGMVLWLLAGLTRVNRLRHAVVAAAERRVALAARAAAAPDAHAAPAGFGVAAGMRRYHRSDCLMLQGKTATTGEPADLAKSGLTPCGVCLPTDPPPGGRHA